MNNIIQPGTRVLITGNHSWTGHTGKFVEFQDTPFGKRPLVELDNGQRCFVMNPDEWRPVERQTFAEAVRDSTDMSKADKDYWLDDND